MVYQIKNDVTCRNLITDAITITIFHITRLKLFVGSFETAYDHALRDNGQYLISEIKAYRSDPLTRTTIEFEILFNDNTLTWNKCGRVKH